MIFFQTPQGEKKGIWHIRQIENDRYVSAICNCHGYWFGGYHGDKPHLNKESVKKCELTGKEIDGIKICPACVEQAYIAGLIAISANV